jgi:hypothetical protein
MMSGDWGYDLAILTMAGGLVWLVWSFTGERMR